MSILNDPERLKRYIKLESEQHIISAELCKRSLKEFVKAAWSQVDPADFVGGYVVDAICEHLQAITFGEINRLLINIPPRMSKSTLVSVLWPVWDWLHHADSKFLCASYSLDLSTADNRRKRILIESVWFQERYGAIIKIKADQSARRFIENVNQGYFMATSVGASVTGKGGSRLILDDPHSVTESHSDADRKSAVRWFREVWSNRLNNQDKDAMITLGQRIDEEDVSGYIIKERPDWTQLILPAFYEPDRHCRTQLWSDWRKEEGELLWPERFSKETLDGLRTDLGTLGFAAQYQQSPIPSGGGQFKQIWFRYFEEGKDAYRLMRDDNQVKQYLKSECKVFSTVDLAVSLKQSADYTVIASWAITPDRDLLLIDRIRGHLDNPQQLQAIYQLFWRLHPEYVLIESTAYQLAIIQQLRRQGLPIRAYNPRSDKVSRASSASVYYEGGKIFHPQNVTWLAEWEEEILKFPQAAHDDQVDALSMASDVLASYGVVSYSKRIY